MKISDKQDDDYEKVGGNDDLKIIIATQRINHPYKDNLASRAAAPSR